MKYRYWLKLNFNTSSRHPHASPASTSCNACSESIWRNHSVYPTILHSHWKGSIEGVDDAPEEGRFYLSKNLFCSSTSPPDSQLVSSSEGGKYEWTKLLGGGTLQGKWPVFLFPQSQRQQQQQQQKQQQQRQLKQQQQLKQKHNDRVRHTR